MTLDTFQLGEPVEHRGIVVTPLFPRRDPVAAYITLDEALPRGFHITETSDAGTVPELVVENPTDAHVLLYDGEELVGAKQNRILNVSVLVEAGAKLPIPVSCVEQGRWSRRSATFARAAARLARAPAAPQGGDARGAAARARYRAGRRLGRGARQAGRGWASARRPRRAGTRSRRTADALRALENAFALAPGQCGAVLALGDDLCLDAVSRPDAFALLWPKLRAGYLLDALERLDGARDLGRADLRRSSTRSAAARATRGPSAGLGDDLRLRGAGVIGSGLELDGRADPALGVHERRQRRARVRPDRTPEPAALTNAFTGASSVRLPACRSVWRSRALLAS